MTRTAALATLFLLLLCVEASAEVPAFLTAEADRVNLTGGLSLDAPLSAIQSLVYTSEDPLAPVQTPPDERIAPTAFVLVADDITAEVDVRYTDPSTAAGGVVSGQAMEPYPYPSGATVATSEIRERFAFFVGPMPGSAPPNARLTAERGSLGAAQASGLKSFNYVDSLRTAIQASAGGAFSWSDPSGWRTLRIEGDFALTLWEIDVRVGHPDGVDELRSGSFFESGLPVPTPGYNVYGTSEARQIYLFVRGGVLEFTFDQAPTLTLNVLAPTVSAEGTSTFRNAEGTLQGPDGPVELRAGDVILEGHVDVALGAIDGSRFMVTATGQPTGATAGGHRYLYPAVSTATEVPGMTIWFALFGTALVAAAAGASVFGRRRALGRQMAHLEDLMDGAKYREAVEAATPALLASRRYQADAQVIRTVSLVRLNRTNEAAATLEMWKGRQDAAFDYLWAFLHAVRGETKLARQRIRSCLQKDASMQEDIDSNPVFAGLLARPSASRAVTEREGYS